MRTTLSLALILLTAVFGCSESPEPTNAFDVLLEVDSGYYEEIIGQEETGTPFELFIQECSSLISTEKINVLALARVNSPCPTEGFRLVWNGEIKADSSNNSTNKIVDLHLVHVPIQSGCLENEDQRLRIDMKSIFERDPGALTEGMLLTVNIYNASRADKYLPQSFVFEILENSGLKCTCSGEEHLGT